ncbi:MAG TPA: hypothetical protein VEK09_06195, partial [Jatrophihabitantaceae bacterium]|nr:hypothetical protein [Jatrophihabitantaceae bacterium]
MTSERSSTTLAYSVGAAGLVGVLLGTFLPWLRSGDVLRNSYASFGVLNRLIGFHGVSDLAVRVWPLIGLCCAGVVVAVVAASRRVAAVLALVTAGWSAAVASVVLLHHGDAGVSVVAVGPAVTLIGDAAVLLA